MESSFLPEPDSARAVLSAIGTGMITLTGFVFSFLLLLVQFGSTAFTPRLTRTLQRDWVVKHALGAFTATFMFSLSALLAVGRLGPGAAPLLTMITVGFLLVLSLGLFFGMIDRVMGNLRVSRVVRLLTVQGSQIFDTVYARPFEPATDETAPVWPADRGTPVQVVRHVAPSAVLVALDRDGLADIARHTRVRIEQIPAVGDDIARGPELFRVYGHRPVSEELLRAALVLGDERTLEDDPGFALRLLVDIAVRALSPAVNDPTTAVQVLDGIAVLLGNAATKDLDVGVVRDEAGVWLTGPAPTWTELLRLGTTEIRQYGRNSVQVLRRLRALLEGLLAIAPPPRHDAVRDELARLDATVEAAFGAEADRIVALMPDPQGIGPFRPSG